MNTKFTFVNAGFSRTRRKGHEMRTATNVQGIRVPMPVSAFDSAEFRAYVTRQTPPGEGWVLTGYALQFPALSLELARSRVEDAERALKFAFEHIPHDTLSLQIEASIVLAKIKKAINAT